MVPAGKKRGDFNKTFKFSEAQIAFVLKEVEDGAHLGGVGRKAEISNATFTINSRKSPH